MCPSKVSIRNVRRLIREGFPESRKEARARDVGRDFGGTSKPRAPDVVRRFMYGGVTNSIDSCNSTFRTPSHINIRIIYSALGGAVERMKHREASYRFLLIANLVH